MTKDTLLLLSLFLVMASSCNFSKGVKKDLATGLSASYNGFSMDDIYLSSKDNNRLNNNTVTLGSPISIIVKGVDNFEEKDGKVFPGCMILLTDKSGKEILNLPDAFSNMVNGITKEETTMLRAQLNTGDPMVTGETYHLKARFYDKKNSTNEIVAKVDLLMK
jgi:hypothetical protein